jgi:hypothetical protein
MNENTDKPVTVSAVVSKETADLLEKSARDNGRSLSGEIRFGIEIYLGQRKPLNA